MTEPNKPKIAKSKVLRRILGYLFRYRWLMLLALGMMLVSNLLALAGPKISGWAIDALSGTGEGGLIFPPLYQACLGMFSEPMVGEVFYYCLLLAAFYLISAVLSYGLAVLMIVISQRIITSMRRDVFHHLTELPVGYFDTHATGDIISRISYDIDTVNASISNDLLQVCASVVTLVGSLVMMLTISPLLTLVFAVTVPMSVLFTRYKTKRIQPLFRARSARLGELNGYAEEMLSGQRTIKAYHREKVILGRFSKRNTDAVDAYYAADYQGSMIGPSVNFINNLSIALVTILGGIFYMFTLTRGAENLPAVLVITLGNVSAFVQYSRKFSGPINEFANILSELQSALAAAERVFRLLDESSETADKPDAFDAKDVVGEVSLENVSFGYTREKEILHNISLRTVPGSITAVVGPTGAGKTTLINLLMRFYDANSGVIRLDGNDILALRRASLRRAYTMVLQDTWLFYGTVFENIAYGKDNATREEVEKAAKAAHIDSFIRRLPNGYDTVLSDDGVNLSKGQKQLITIARAMLPDSAMLILDEATSNVDSRTEKQIQQVLYALMEGRTCFVIAHRLSTVRNADCILVVSDGRIIEQGTHEELLRQNGFYSKLFRAQYQ